MTARMYQDSFPVAKKLKHLSFDWNDKSVFEIGCNTGQLGLYVLERGARSYVGVDSTETYVLEGRRRYPHLNISHARAQDVEVEGDVLVALGVFHHMIERDVLDFVGRSPSKWLIMEQPMQDGPFQNYRIRNEQWYVGAAVAAGFTSVERVEYGFSYPINRKILVCKKP